MERAEGQALERRTSVQLSAQHDLRSLSRSFSLRRESSITATVSSDLDEPREPVRGGRVYSWGRNHLMHETSGTLSVEKFEARGVVGCATSGWHALVADDEGSVFAAGANASGEVSSTREEEVVKPTRVEEFPVGVRVASVACGLSFSACVTFSGQVLAWGLNDQGQVTAVETLVKAPRLVRGGLQGRRVSQVSCGDAFVVARTELYEVYVWGSGEACCEETNVFAPKLLTELVGVTAVAAGAAHAVAVAASGRAYAWGRDKYGQCGSDDDAVTRPSLVKGLANVTAAAAGRAHSLFVLGGRRVVGLGRDHCGQISGSPRVEPVRHALEAPVVMKDSDVIVAVAAGDSHSLVASKGGLWAFGSNKAGALGATDPEITYARVQVDADSNTIVVDLDAAGDSSMAVLADTGLRREHSLARALSRARPVTSMQDASLVAQGAVTGHQPSLDRLFAVFAVPGRLAASFLRQAVDEDDLQLDMRALEKCLVPEIADILAGAVARGADTMAAATDADSPDAARVVLVYLRAAALTGGEEQPTKAAWQAARAAVELLLATSDACRARLLAAVLRPGEADVRDALRQTLKRLVAVAAMRAAIDARLPIGDGIDLKEAIELLGDLDTADRNNEAATSQGEAPAQQTNTNSVSVRETIQGPAKLAKLGLLARQSGLFEGVSLSDTFSAGLRGALALDLLRSASMYRVPRSETATAYRVPEVDGLGVIVARRVAQTPYGREVIAVQPAPGALLVDFMRWRELGGPRGPPRVKTVAADGGRWCFASFPFLVSPETKRELCAVEARRRQGAAGARAQQMLFRDGMHFPLAGLAGQASPIPYMILRVPRAHLLQAALNMLQAMPDSEFSKELKVVFEGEEGVDEGGVKKEFFALLVPQLFDPTVGMFIEQPENCLFFNPHCDWYDVEYELAGILVGLAAYNQVVLDVTLPRLAYKKLLAHLAQDQDDIIVFTLDDLEELDSSLAAGLRSLLDFDDAAAVEDTFCRSFVDDDVELMPGGADIAVTGDNRVQFVQLFLERRLVRAVQTQFDLFARGFSRVMQTAMLNKIVEPEELMTMVQGDPVLDFTTLESAAFYEGFPPDHPVIKELWSFVHDLDPDDQKKFLMFVTGSRSAPMGGLGALRPPAHSPFRIQRMSADTDRLPTAHTCFNTLLIPDYDPPSKLRPLLKRAILDCEGFGLK